MYIDVRRVPHPPAKWKKRKAYAVSTGPETCELYFVSQNGDFIKQVTSNVSPHGDLMVIVDNHFDASAGVLPDVQVAGSVFVVGTPGIIDGVLMPAGTFLYSLVADPDPDHLVAGEWATSLAPPPQTENIEIVAVNGQVTFPFVSLAVMESVVLSFDGYTLLPGTRLEATPSSCTVLDAGFDFEDGDVVNVSYTKSVPS